MARTRCYCGEVISTIVFPNDIEWTVYSGIEWDAYISNEPILMENFPDPSVDVWKCPHCQRLLIYNGDDGKLRKVYVLEHDMRADSEFNKEQKEKPPQ